MRRHCNLYFFLSPYPFVQPTATSISHRRPMGAVSGVQAMIQLFEDINTVRSAPCTGGAVASPRGATPDPSIATATAIATTTTTATATEVSSRLPPPSPLPPHLPPPLRQLDTNSLLHHAATSHSRLHLVRDRQLAKQRTAVKCGKPRDVMIPTHRLRTYTRALTAQNAELQALRDKLLVMSAKLPVKDV